MKLIAGVDIGNSTTEVVIGEIKDRGSFRILAYGTTNTTGTKGTLQNISGIKEALNQALDSISMSVSDLTSISMNEATPVIGDTAMETITETLITESSMIGHNPLTPAGFGFGTGWTLPIHVLMGDTPLDIMKEKLSMKDTSYILVVDNSVSYEQVAFCVNQYNGRNESKENCGYPLKGIILQADEAVLVYNRLNVKIPVIDEVSGISKIPYGVFSAIEVALKGQAIQMLSNPYGIATLLNLNGEETKSIIPIAKSLLGKQSGVILKTSHGNVIENKIPAGELLIHGDDKYAIGIDEGAKAIMKVLEGAGNIIDIRGSKNTNIGNMLEGIKEELSQVTFGSKEKSCKSRISITDALAVDTLAPVKVQGALANETCLEKAVGIAAMVKTNQLPMKKIASALSLELGVDVEVAGVEAKMASIGAITTKGVSLPLALLDMGGGSTDGALIHEDGSVEVIHMAGAGQLVTLLIQTELGIHDKKIAEEIKKYPLAKVESLHYIRLESGAIQFIEEGLHPEFFGCVIILHPEGYVKIKEDLTLERIVQVRREAKEKVFVENAKRTLRRIAPKKNIRNISNIMLVGGSALDFEIPSMLMSEFMKYNIVCGRGNVMGSKGPRYAVATGLVLSNISY